MLRWYQGGILQAWENLVFGFLISKMNNRTRSFKATSDVLYWILDDWDREFQFSLEIMVISMPVVKSWFIHLDTVRAGTNSRASG